MAAKVRPSSAYGRAEPQDRRLLSIGSKASAAAPPARLRSPPRPPTGASNRGVRSPPRRDYYQSTTNGNAHRPLPTPSKSAAPLATPKWSARAPSAPSGAKSREWGVGNSYPRERGVDSFDAHGSQEDGDPQTNGEQDQDPDLENFKSDEHRGDEEHADGEEGLQADMDDFENQDIMPDEGEGEDGVAPDECEDEFNAEEEDAERDFRDELYREIDPGSDQEPAIDDVPRREGDLSLDEIPDDQREAVEGNLQLKRALSQDLELAASKRRRTDSGPPQIENETSQRLIRQWRLDRDSTTSFVLRMADPETVEALAKSRWTPNPAGKRTPAEQVYEQLTKLKERQGPPAGPLDAVAAFGHRWHLTAADDDALAKLDHKSMRHVFREYDKSRPLPEIIEDTYAGAVFDDDDVAVPNKPGLYVLGRSQCLELIDPFGDALVLGDANLTFSLQLAEHRKSLHHVGRTVATTFEKRETLRERYREIDQTIKTLEELGAEVLHNVDCTRLAVDPRFQGMEEKFGAVYYNFPHAGVVPGFFDGHPFVRWRHANLMHLFFRALRTFVKPGGSVKVSSNSGATGVRYSDIIGGASASEFAHAETFPFLEWTLSRYSRSYGDRRDEQRRPEDGEVYRDQRARSDMVYCFTYTPTGTQLKAPNINYPPTKEELLASNEGKAGRLPSGVGARRKRVEELYELFLSYVQGIHVG
mmetsp:Transcript_21926/g.58540  ORF Transcript_21926/g.58540 Transcript_21926/m.58540 type:complete len:701 (+) Transcript_21926:85-2187(+)